MKKRANKPTCVSLRGEFFFGGSSAYRGYDDHAIEGRGEEGRGKRELKLSRKNHQSFSNDNPVLSACLLTCLLTRINRPSNHTTNWYLPTPSRPPQQGNYRSSTLPIAG
jgi:hypothetical protein